ncbi:MAG TPA: hypothetical protein DCW68_01775 [Rhodospirillaceae bacterium]|nr:MAG: hypothetical protein A2018_04740 [Alphaproteobacteria bacterium GWF2_58_20]HAU28825.1 hypothetical protein [Rhodospirillaceae bacterium]
MKTIARILAPLARIPAGITLLGAIGIIATFTPWGLAANAVRWLAFSIFFAGCAFEIGRRFKPGCVLKFDAVDFSAIAFVAYAILSIAWSADISQGLISGIRLLALLMVFLHIRSHAADFAMKAVAPIAILGSLITLGFTIAFPDSFGGFFQENFSTEAYLALLPYLFMFTAFAGSMAFRKETRSIAAILATLMGALPLAGILIYLLAFNASKIELFILPALVFYAFLRFDIFKLGRKRFAAGGILVVAAFAAGGMLMPHILATPSINVRVPLWVNSFFMWMDAPILGHGLGSFRATYPLFGESFAQLVGLGFESQTRGGIIGDMAHNEGLHLMAEMGIAGLSLAIAFVAAAFLHLRTRKEPLSLMQEAAAMSLLAILGIAAIEFPFHVPTTAFIATISLSILLAGEDRIMASLPLPDAYPRFMARLLLAVFSIGLIGMSCLDLRASIHFNQTKILMGRGYGEEAFRELDAARRIWPLDSKLRSLLFPTLMRWQRLSGLRYGTDIPLEFYPENVAKIHEISFQATPHDNGILNDWMRYLIMSMVFENTPEKTREIEEGLKTLKNRAKLDPDTWVTEGFYALETKDIPRGLAAVEKGRALAEAGDLLDATARETILKQFRWMEDSLSIGQAVPANIWKDRNNPANNPK